MSSESVPIKPILKQGQIILEDVPELILCKPRLIPLKSFTLEKLEKMQFQTSQAKPKDSPQNSE